MRNSCDSRMYHFEGELVPEHVLLERFAKESGVTASIFRNRVRVLNWDIERALTTPPTEQEQRPAYKSKEAADVYIKVIFTQPMSGVYPHMQPKLYKMYDARYVRLSSARHNHTNAAAKNEFVVITLENGKPLLAYKGEYVECENTTTM